MASNEVLDPGLKLSVAVTQPSSPLSGAPVRWFTMTGVALTDKGAGGNSSGNTTVDFGYGSWNLSVFDGVGGGIAVGDSVYFADTPVGSPATNLTNVATSNTFFGIAKAVVTAAATTTIEVFHPVNAGLLPAGAIAAGSVTGAKLAANIIDDSKVVKTTSGNVLGTVPVIFRQDFAAGANADATIVVTDKMLVIDAWLVLTGAGVATEVVTLKNGASAMATALAASGADGTVARAVTWVTAQRTLNAGASLVISPGTGASQPNMSVFVECMPTA